MTATCHWCLLGLDLGKVSSDLSRTGFGHRLTVNLTWRLTGPWLQTLLPELQKPAVALAFFIRTGVVQAALRAAGGFQNTLWPFLLLALGTPFRVGIGPRLHHH